MDSIDPEPLTSDEIEELSDAIDSDESINEEHIELLSQTGIRLRESGHKNKSER